MKSDSIYPGFRKPVTTSTGTIYDAPECNFVKKTVLESQPAGNNFVIKNDTPKEAACVWWQRPQEKECSFQFSARIKI